MSNLLFLCDTFPPNAGGSESMLRDLALAAVSSGHSVVVFTPSAEDKPDASAAEAEFDRSAPYIVIRSPAWRRLQRLGASRSGVVNRLARAAIIFLTYWRAAAVGGVDAVIAGHAVPLGNVAAAVGKRRGAPTILITYGEEVATYSRGPRMRRLLQSALRAADAVVCLTRSGERELLALVPALEGRISVFPPAARMRSREECGDDVDRLRREHGLEGRQVLLTVGRLTPRKGIDVTLAALSLLAAEFPDLRYAVVGTGADRTRLQLLASQLGVDGLVTFAGAAESVDAWHHLADVFAMPNRTLADGECEGYGIVFLEAALAGKAVVAGDSGGAAEAVLDGQTGLLVADPADPSQVAAAVRRLLKDPALAARLGDAGRRRALEIASSEALRVRFEETIGTALARRR